MDEVNPIVEITIPDPEPIVTASAPSEVKPEELSPSYPQSVDNPITSDNLVPITPVTSVVTPSAPVGRPCKYCTNKEDLQGKTDRYIEMAKKGRNGKPMIPYIEELALELDTIDSTIVDWAQKKNKDGSLEHPEFTSAYATVKMIQKLRLQQRALGRYQPVGAIKLLQFNHGMMETSKQVLAGDPNEPLSITIIEEDSEKYQE